MDDAICYAKDKALIDRVILSLKDEYLLERKEDIAGFLGIIITKNTPDGTVTLAQTGLIDIILEVMRLENSNLRFILADKIPLHKDEHGSLCMEEWNYRLVVGILLYLVGSTRPDIAYDVH